MTVSADLPARQAESAPLANRHPVRALAPDKRDDLRISTAAGGPRGVISQEAKIVWQALAIDAREQEGVLFTRNEPGRASAQRRCHHQVRTARYSQREPGLR